jgi:hypothetical protein
MTTTSNGRPWGENTGRVASGVFYGYAVKRGVEAAQRREATESDTLWSTPAAAANVTMQWVLFAGIVLINAWTITNAVVMSFVNYFDPMQNGHLSKGLTATMFALPAVALSVMTISAARAKVRRAEGLPPKRNDRYLSWRFFPKGWLAMFFLPQWAYIPFYISIR